VGAAPMVLHHARKMSFGKARTLLPSRSASLFAGNVERRWRCPGEEVGEADVALRLQVGEHPAGRWQVCRLSRVGKALELVGKKPGVEGLVHAAEVTDRDDGELHRARPKQRQDRRHVAQRVAGEDHHLDPVGPLDDRFLEAFGAARENCIGGVGALKRTCSARADGAAALLVTHAITAAQTTRIVFLSMYVGRLLCWS
jgi:hypothetical protein